MNIFDLLPTFIRHILTGAIFLLGFAMVFAITVLIIYKIYNYAGENGILPTLGIAAAFVVGGVIGVVFEAIKRGESDNEISNIKWYPLWYP